MKTNFIQRVHAPYNVKNIVSYIVEENEWFINIKKFQKAGFNLNFFSQGAVRYR